jgi:putative ABC transport system permease protein
MALASEMPFYSAPVWSVTVEGAVFPHALGGPTTSYVLIGTRYFETLGLGPIRGRVFHDRDGTPGHETVIVNQLFASKYLAGRDPLGQRIRLTNPNRLADIAPWLTVVGVSPTVRQQEIDPVVYVPYWVTPLAQMTVLTRTRTEAAAVTPILREQLRQLDPDMPFVDIRPLTWLLSGTRFANRVAVAFFSLAAALGLLLAAVGLHAVTAHAIRQRTQEIGVRMALGAHASQIVWLFVRGMLAPLGWGVLLGILGALAVGRFVRGMLIQTSPTDPLTLVSIAVVLVVVALAATFRPARRGSRLDPVAALRCE